MIQVKNAREKNRRKKTINEEIIKEVVLLILLKYNFLWTVHYSFKKIWYVAKLGRPWLVWHISEINLYDMKSKITYVIILVNVNNKIYITTYIFWYTDDEIVFIPMICFLP